MVRTQADRRRAAFSFAFFSGMIAGMTVPTPSAFLARRRVGMQARHTMNVTPPRVALLHACLHGRPAAAPASFLSASSAASAHTEAAVNASPAARAASPVRAHQPHGDRRRPVTRRRRGRGPPSLCGPRVFERNGPRMRSPLHARLDPHLLALCCLLQAGNRTSRRRRVYHAVASDRPHHHYGDLTSCPDGHLHMDGQINAKVPRAASAGLQAVGRPSSDASPPCITAVIQATRRRHYPAAAAAVCASACLAAAAARSLSPAADHAPDASSNAHAACPCSPTVDNLAAASSYDPAACLYMNLACSSLPASTNSAAASSNA